MISKTSLFVLCRVKLNLENMKTIHNGSSTRPATPGQSGNNTPLHNEDSNMSGVNSNADQDEDMDDDDEEEEQTNVPAALVRWRRAVGETESAAQLLLCAMQLNRAIAWEKSIMKVVSSVALKAFVLNRKIMKNWLLYILVICNKTLWI